MNYLTSADDLAQMVADGTFPSRRHFGETASAPRVGDGLIRLDASGRVSYASPNAQSAYRRLGLAAHLVGEDLAAVTRRLTDDPLDGSDAGARIQAALRGDAPPRKEIEARGASVLQRALPLLPAGVPIGALVLVRDVTELRRRPGAHDEGDHDPRDPSPGEEQPTDGRVADNGRAPPKGFDVDASERLGLHVVRAFARGELRGPIEMRGREGAGPRRSSSCRSSDTFAPRSR
jgi:hypothetical protein